MPGCKSVLYDKNREKTNIYLFNIPKRNNLWQKRFIVLKHIRRKGADNVDVNSRNKRIIYVCEFSFRDKELKILWAEGKRKLYQGGFFQLSEKKTKLNYKTTTEESSNVSSSIRD